MILDVDPDHRTMRVRLPHGDADLPTRYLDAGNVGLAYAIRAEDPLDILAAGLECRRNKRLALDSIAAAPLDAWSPADLVAERRRIQTVLDQTPPDRTADLAALGNCDTPVRHTRRIGSGRPVLGRRRAWRQRACRQK